MRARGRRACGSGVLVGLGLQACFYDEMSASGPSSGESGATATTAGTGDPAGSTSTGAVTTGSPDTGTSTGAAAGTTSSGTTVGADTGTDAGTTTSGDTTGPGTTGTSTGAAGACADDEVVKLLVLAEDAEVVFPMEQQVSAMGEGTYASSPIAELGTADFAFEVPCADDYVVWGRVFDGDPGPPGANDPDSFYVTADDGAEAGWFYGCQTEFLQGSWSWLKIRTVRSVTCDGPVDLSLALAAGTHHVELRNREPENAMGLRAGIARMLITNDLDHVPTNE